MVLFTIFCPIVAAVLTMLGAPARKTALAASVLMFLAALFLFASLDYGHAEFQHVTSFSISPEWRLSFTTGVDGLSVIMMLLASVVTLAAVWFAGPIERYEHAFYACLLFIAGGAIGAFASIDLFFFYAFHELALIPTFLLIGIWGSGNRVAAAWKITIYLAIGSFILLLGLILLYQSFPLPSRSFDIRVLQTAAGMGQIAPDAQRHVYLLLLIGFGILISLFPFHTWAPEAYAAAPAPAAMLHAGVLKKFGLYGLLRLAVPMLPEGARLGNSAYRAATWEHHLRRTCYHRAEATRLDAGLFERDAHGLHFSRNRQLWCSRCDRCRCIDVRSRSRNRPAIWYCRRVASADGHVGF
jgi:NADH-quinone oxidoreductase subunit M